MLNETYKMTDSCGLPKGLVRLAGQVAVWLEPHAPSLWPPQWSGEITVATAGTLPLCAQGIHNAAQDGLWYAD